MARLDNIGRPGTGASRGAGRGIALELGGAGATVYVTVEVSAGGPTTDNVPGHDRRVRQGGDRPGGHGIAVRCDHTVDAEVEALFGRIRHDHGRLDILVNNVWGGYENSECRPLPLVPFWSSPSFNGTACSAAGSARISSRAAWPCR